MRLLVDVRSIEKAAACGLPFCGNDETEDRKRAVQHIEAYAAKILSDRADQDDESTGVAILTADRDLLVLAGNECPVIYVSFESDGSHITELTEPVSADQLSLERYVGEKTAAALISEYGSFHDIEEQTDQISFFGAEKIIKSELEKISCRYEELKDMSVDGLMSDGRLVACDTSESADVSDKMAQTADYGNDRPVFINDYSDTRALSELVLTAKDCLDGKVRLVFDDLKAILHALGREAGLPSEIIKDETAIHEEKDVQLSLYNAIMDIERRAWQESLDSDISYGSALHRYMDDVVIEDYIINPLEKVQINDADELMKRHVIAQERLAGTDEGKLYTELELPLIFVLYDMEHTGIYMDAARLNEYGMELGRHIDELEQRIYEEAGEEFNINSPKQLGEILFGKLGLPKGKKTKTGYSTSQKVLDELADDYPIVSDVLSYRKYAKLKSTYADGLNNCVAADGRVHTTYQQTVTATGRLSSTDPNLQNIPIRLELGKQIRKVFLPSDGSFFLDADYSQIELRVLAHMSGDENLIDAYRADKDIHTATAAAVFHVRPDEVTPLMRRSAKAVNFGIVYGISSFGLGQNLSISRSQAQEYIDDYFKAYPGLHSFLNGLVDQAKIKGYAETMYGRRRPIPELSDQAYMRRQFGERVAMNAPIQGSAADIIKIAMRNVYIRLRKENMKSRLLLQVHDELLIEAPSDEKEAAEKILREEMENAAKLKVPLEVDLQEGTDWYSAH